MHVIVWSIIANPLLSKFNAAPHLLFYLKRRCNIQERDDDFISMLHTELDVTKGFHVCWLYFVYANKKRGGEIKNFYFIITKKIFYGSAGWQGFQPLTIKKIQFHLWHSALSSFNNKTKPD